MKFRLLVLILLVSIFIFFIIFDVLPLQNVPLLRKMKKPKSDIPNLILKEDLSLGGKGEKENYLFTRIRVDVDDEENLYVLDERLRNVRVFDKNGKFVQTIGEIGQGPGEFQYPVIFIQVTSKKELVVYDRGLRKFIFYSLNGEYLKQISATRLAIPYKIRIDSNENFIGIILGFPPSLELKKFNSNLEVLDVFFNKKTDIEPGYDLRVAEPTVYFALTHDDNIIWGYSDRYELRIVNPDGKTIGKINKNHKPVRFTKKDKDRYRKIYERIIKPGARLIFPSHFPSFGDISVDDSNRIFVMTYKKTSDGRNYYDIFNSEGKYLTRVPLEFSPIIWKNNKVYAIIEAEEGYSIIKRYTVEWK